MMEPLEISFGKAGYGETHAPLLVKIFGWTIDRVWRDELGNTICITLEKDGIKRDYKLT